MSGAASRRKGQRGEQAVVRLLRIAGWSYARRSLQSGAQGGGDIEAGPRGVVIEVKRHAGRLDLPAAYRQAEDACAAGQTPMVVHRRDGNDWLATLPALFVLDLLAEREGLRARPEQAAPAPTTLIPPASPYDPGEWA